MAPTFSKPVTKAARKGSSSEKVPTKVDTGFDLSPKRKKLHGTRIHDPYGKYDYFIDFEALKLPDSIAVLSATSHHRSSPDKKTGAYTREFEKCLVNDLNGLTAEGDYNFQLTDKLKISDVLDERGPDGKPLHRVLNPMPGNTFYRKVFIYLIESDKEWKTEDYDNWAKKIVHFLNEDGPKLGFWKFSTLCKYAGCSRKEFVNDILLDSDTAHLLKCRYVDEDVKPEDVVISEQMRQYFREPTKAAKQLFLDVCNDEA